MATSIVPVGLMDSPQSKTPTSVLGKDAFLRLLVTQLRYQDPLNPMEGTEFASQLAQFSSVEQLSNINTSLTQSIVANQMMSQSIGNSLAATLIGKEVRASGNAFTVTGTDPVQLGYALSGNAESVVVKVYDQAGGLVRTIAGTGTGKGDQRLTWDGKDSQGQQVAPGKYTFAVEARDDKGATVTVSPFMQGTITGVRFKADGAYFVIDGTEVALSDVLEILKT